MAANVESMLYVRQAPWHGLGVRVETAPSSEEALRLSGLNWNVIQQPIKTRGGVEIPGYKANLRDVDNQVLGVVTDRYRVVQNAEAFAFTDALLGEGVKYETAGSLQNGRKIWLLAKLPDRYIIEGDQVEPYIDLLLPMDDQPTDTHRKNMTRLREDMKRRYVLTEPSHSACSRKSLLYVRNGAKSIVRRMSPH